MSLYIKSLKSSLEWNKNISETFPFDFTHRFNQYSKIIKKVETLEKEYESLCNILDLTLQERIGSESQNGEVYTNNIQDSVVKILPLKDKNSFEMNEKEMKIAQHASQIVLEGLSTHFPIVYDFGYCQDFSGYKYKNISSHFIISERATCDLHQYLMYKKLTKERKNKIKIQCLKAISDMHKYLGVCHNDLHLRNFLVIENNQNDVLILIHDFGSAEYRDTHLELDYEFFEKEFTT